MSPHFPAGFEPRCEVFVGVSASFSSTLFEFEATASLADEASGKDATSAAGEDAGSDAAEGFAAG
jgi:hypothetical protein